nr:hypothetical protein [Actinomycetales bacterium]
ASPITFTLPDSAIAPEWHFKLSTVADPDPEAVYEAGSQVLVEGRSILVLTVPLQRRRGSTSTAPSAPSPSTSTTSARTAPDVKKAPVPQAPKVVGPGGTVDGGGAPSAETEPAVVADDGGAPSAETEPAVVAVSADSPASAASAPEEESANEDQEERE